MKKLTSKSKNQYLKTHQLHFKQHANYMHLNNKLTNQDKVYRIICIIDISIVTIMI